MEDSARQNEFRFLILFLDTPCGSLFFYCKLLNIFIYVFSHISPMGNSYGKDHRLDQRTELF